MARLKLEDGMAEGFDDLYCPNCSKGYMHHDKVEVFECAEDSDGLHVTVDAGTVSVDRDLTGNPSSRRHGLLVHFWCEGCEAKSVLSIEQHKGSTYLGITYTMPEATQ